MHLKNTLLVVLFLAVGSPHRLRGELAIAIDPLPADSSQALLSWETTPGKRYAILSATDLLAPWAMLSAEGAPWIAASDLLSHTVSVDEPLQFFRIAEADDSGTFHLVGEPGDGQILFTYPAMPGATAYTLYYDVSPGVNGTTGTAITMPASPFPLTGLQNGTPYYARASYTDALGESPLSLEIAVTPQSASASPYDPDWARVPPTQTRVFNYDTGQSSTENGTNLKSVLQSLQPGDRLEIASGTYSIDSYTTISLQGTAEAPIWIAPAPGAAVVITRPNAGQNILNVGAGAPTRYVCLRGLEFVGGSHGIRLYDCAQVWIDQCRVHHTGDVGISANAHDTDHLYITRNEIWNTGGTGEGMYLGGNYGSVRMSESIIALNHVHDTDNSVTQGDGIEVKQGSWGNWIVENLVHDCNYPCILVYGTAGQPPNVVERNICYRSNDHTIQIQGDCIVRNNLALAAAGSAFASQPHQGDPTRMTVVHNTFVNAGRAVRLSTWGQGQDMTFANNACYSQNAAALNVVNGSAGVVFSGNVCVGSVTSGVDGYQTGVGLTDFIDVHWDGTPRDARPSVGSTLRAAADPTHATPADLTGTPRAAPHTSGCYGP